MPRTLQTTTHRTRRRARLTLGLVVASSLIAAACGSDDDDAGAPSVTGTGDAPSTSPTPGTQTGPDRVTTAPDATGGSAPAGGEGEPVAGGSLTYLHPFTFTGFDPAIANVNTQFSLQNFAVYDALAIVWTFDGSTQLRLLESAESTDGVSWTLKIRPDVVFSDGTAFDAEAIKRHWERLADPATAAVAAPVAQTITTMTVVDDLTLEVTLAEPNGQFPTTIATSALTWVPSPSAVAADPEGFNASPIGAGAFTVSEWRPNTEVVLAKNPDYFGTVHLDQVVIKEIPDEAQRYSTLQSGEGDVMRTVSGVTAQSAIDAGYDHVTTSPNGGYVVFFNVTAEPFDDVRARQAIALAMNGQQLSDVVYGGFREPADNTFRENSPFYDPALDQPASDDAAAQALLDELAAENGGPIEVSLAYVGAFTAEAEWFQTKLAGFENIEVTLELVDSAEFQQKYTSGDTQFGIHSYNIMDPDGLTLFTGTGAPNNYSLYTNPEMDALLEQGRASMDAEQRKQIYGQVQALLLEDVPYTFFLRRQGWEVFDGTVVHGLTLEHQQSTNGEAMLNEAWVTR